MKANEINEGIMRNVGYVPGNVAGRGVNAVGNVAGRAVRGVKNLGKAAGHLATGALDALAGNPQPGAGEKVVKSLTGSLLPKYGDQVSYPIVQNGKPFKMLFTVVGVDEQDKEIKLSSKAGGSKTVSLSDFNKNAKKISKPNK